MSKFTWTPDQLGEDKRHHWYCYPSPANIASGDGLSVSILVSGEDPEEVCAIANAIERMWVSVKS